MSVSSSTIIPPIPSLNNSKFKFKNLARPIYLETDNISDLFSISYNQNSIIEGVPGVLNIWNRPNYLKNIKLKYFVEYFDLLSNGKMGYIRYPITDKNSILYLLNSPIKDKLYQLRCDVFLGKNKISKSKYNGAVNNAQCVAISKGTQPLRPQCKEVVFSLKNYLPKLFNEGYSPFQSLLLEPPKINPVVTGKFVGGKLFQYWDGGFKTGFNCQAIDIDITPLNYVDESITLTTSNGQDFGFSYKQYFGDYIPEKIKNINISGTPVRLTCYDSPFLPFDWYNYGENVPIGGTVFYTLQNRAGTSDIGRIVLTGSLKSGFIRSYFSQICPPPFLDVAFYQNYQSSLINQVYSGYKPPDATGFLLKMYLKPSDHLGLPYDGVYINRELDISIYAPGYMVPKIRTINNGTAVIKPTKPDSLSYTETIEFDDVYNYYNYQLPTTGENLVGPIRFRLKKYDTYSRLPYDCGWVTTQSLASTLESLSLSGAEFNFKLNWPFVTGLRCLVYSGMSQNDILDCISGSYYGTTTALSILPAALQNVANSKDFEFNFSGYMENNNFNIYKISGSNGITNFTRKPFLLGASFTPIPTSQSLTMNSLRQSFEFIQGRPSCD